LILEGEEFASVLLRLGEGSSGEEGVVGEEAAALCMNFIVKSLEDMAFGAWLGLLVADIVAAVKLTMKERVVCLGPVLPLLVYSAIREQNRPGVARMSIVTGVLKLDFLKFICRLSQL
jgi:hypothetical protein